MSDAIDRPIDADELLFRAMEKAREAVEKDVDNKTKIPLEEPDSYRQGVEIFRADKAIGNISSIALTEDFLQRVPVLLQDYKTLAVRHTVEKFRALGNKEHKSEKIEVVPFEIIEEALIKFKAEHEKYHESSGKYDGPLKTHVSELEEFFTQKMQITTHTTLQANGKQLPHFIRKYQEPGQTHEPDDLDHEQPQKRRRSIIKDGANFKYFKSDERHIFEQKQPKEPVPRKFDEAPASPKRSPVAMDTNPALRESGFITAAIDEPFNPGKLPLKPTLPGAKKGPSGRDV